MSLWGAGEATKPTWAADDSPVVDKQAVFATESGWVLRHYKKADQTEFWDEILVAGDFGNTGGLEAVLGNATIDGVYFEATEIVAATTATVVVNYNEEVTVTVDGSNKPTLQVRDETTGGNVAGGAVYARGSGSNRLEFDFTAPAASKELRLNAQTLTTPGSSAIKDKGTNTASDLAFATGDVLGAEGVTKASNNDRVTTS